MDFLALWIACGSAGAILCLVGILRNRKLLRFDWLGFVVVITLGPIGFAAAIVM